MLDGLYTTIFGDREHCVRVKCKLYAGLKGSYNSVKKIKVKGHFVKTKVKLYVNENEYLADYLVNGEIRDYIDKNITSLAYETEFKYYFI